MKSQLVLACLPVLVMVALVPPVSAWSNGGYSSDQSNPDYGTHDYLTEHAFNMLPAAEQSAIVHTLSLMLYGTEMPDNPAEIGDTFNHHVYYDSSGQLTDDVAADRAQAEYDLALGYLQAEDWTNADKHIGAMAHYITDLGVFGHVMGSSTPWGSETHHSDYESYALNRTDSYTSSEFDGYIVYDGSLTGVSAYNAVSSLAYAITFGSGSIQSCTWMDTNYSWSNTTFKDSCGASMNLAVNYLAEVLHKLYLDYNPEVTSSAPTLSYGSVIPASGDSGTTFTYEVTYADVDGDAPSYVKVYIDGAEHSTTEISGSYTSGVIYRYTTSLGIGSHTYYFSASDNTGLTARLPSSGSSSGPSVNSPPTASFTYSPTSPTTDNTIQFTDSSTDSDGTISSRSWNFGDSSGTSTSQNPTHKYSSPGTYTVTVTVTDNGGATGSASKNISVGNPPQPGQASTTLSISSATFTLQSGGSTTLTATLTSGGSPLSGKTVTWSATSGSLSASSGATNSSGQATVTYTASSVTTQASVIVTASFAGDTAYNASQGSSTGTISPVQLTVSPSSTSLTVAPPSFTIGSGKNLSLTATLFNENGAPLSGKTTSLVASAGTLSAASGTTNSSGKVSFTYTAPTVSTQTSVMIMASFAGDTNYLLSNATSTGPVLIKEVAQVLENLKENLATQATQLEIQVENEQLQALENAFANGTLGACITVRAGLVPKTEFQQENLALAVQVTAGQKIEVTVENVANVKSGQTVVLNIDNDTVPALQPGGIEVLYDNMKIGLASDYADVLDPTDENTPEYLVLFGGNGAQILVSIPHFSTHTITIATMPTVPTAGIPPLYLVLGAALGLVVVTVAVVWYRLKKSRKKDMWMGEGEKRREHGEEKKREGSGDIGIPAIRASKFLQHRLKFQSGRLLPS